MLQKKVSATIQVTAVVDGKDGTSPWIADLDNEMDSVSCDNLGLVSAEQSVKSAISLYYGATRQDFKVTAVTRRYGTDNATSKSYTTNNQSQDGVTVSLSAGMNTAANANTITVTYGETAKITGKDLIVITVTDASGGNARQLTLTVNGIKDSVYNLKPAKGAIVATRKADGTFNLTGIVCGYTKKAIDGTVTEVDDVSETHTSEPSGGYPLYVEGKYNIWYHRHLRGGDWETSTYNGNTNYSWSAYNYAANREAIVNGFDPNVYDAVEFLLCTERGNGRIVPTLNGIVDREVIDVVSDGASGKDGKDGENGISGPYLKAHTTLWAFSSSGTTAPGSGWQSGRLTPTAEAGKKYVWRKDTYTYDAPERGRNLLRGTADYTYNGSGTESWSKGGYYLSGSGGSVTRVTDQALPIAGVASALRITRGSSADYGVAQGELTLKAGKLTLSVWVKGSSGTKVRLQPAWQDGVAITNLYKELTLADNEWTLLTWTSQIPTAGNYRIGYLYCATANATIYATGFKVEYGDEPTDWCIAPEDLNREETSVWAVYGESPWIADLDNEMDSVSCDEKGIPVKSQMISTVLSLFCGATMKTIGSIAVKRNGTAMPVNPNTAHSNEYLNGVAAIWTPSLRLLRFYYDVSKQSSYDYGGTTYYTTAAVINGSDDFEITLTAAEDVNVSRTLHLTVNAVVGDVYNLLPREREIVAAVGANGRLTVDGSETVRPVCGYTKRANGEVIATSESVTTGQINIEKAIFYRLRNRSTGKWQMYDSTKGVWGRFYSGTSEFNVNTYDAIEYIIVPFGEWRSGYAAEAPDCIDREVVHVVSDGKDGKDGESGISGPYLKAHTTLWAFSSSGTTAPGSGWQSSRLTPTAEASKKYVWRKDTYTYDAPERGRNLLRGTADLNVGSGTWSSGTVRRSGTGTIARDTSQVLPIAGVQSSVLITASSSAECGIAQDSFTLNEGKITMSCWIKGTAGSKVRLQPVWNSSAGAPGYKYFNCNGEWQYMSVTVTIAVGGSYSIGYVYTSGSGNTAYVTGLKLEYGDEPTDWCIAPEDLNREETSVWAVYGDMPEVSIGANGNWFVDGEDTHVRAEGRDGTGVDIKGSVATYNSLPSSANVGDCYICEDNRHLYMWTGSGWKDLGEFKGKDGESSYMHIAWADKITFGTDGKTPASKEGFTNVYDGKGHDWIGFCTNNTENDPGEAEWRSYKWNYVKGTDGDGYEYVYMRTTSMVAPVITEDYADSQGRSRTQDEYLPKATNYYPAEFTDDPQGVNETYRYEYEAVRKKTNGVWGRFSSPSLHSNYAEDGADGKDGKDGKDAAQVVFSPSILTVQTDETGYISAPVTKSVDVVLMLNGAPVSWSGITVAVSGSSAVTARYNTSTQRIDVTLTADDSGEWDDGVVTVTLSGTSGGKAYSATGTLTIAVLRRGLQGQSGENGRMGKICYFAGTYRDNIVYTSNERQTVAVEVDTGGDKTEIYFLKEDVENNLDASGNPIAPPDTRAWEQGLSEYNLIRTRYLFSDFAHLGSAIVSGDWMFSQHGTVNGSAQSGAGYYTKFDPHFPLGEGTYYPPLDYSGIAGSSYIQICEIDIVRGCSYGFSVYGLVAAAGSTLYIRYYGVRNDSETQIGSIYSTESDASVQFASYTLDAGHTYDKIRVKALCRNGAYIENVKVTAASGSGLFVPNYALDMLRGTTYQNSGVFRGSLEAARYMYKMCFMEDTNLGDVSTPSEADYVVASSYGGSIPLGNPNTYAGKVITVINKTRRSDNSYLYLSSSYNIALFDGAETPARTLYIGWSRMVKVWADGNRGVWRVIEQDLY